MQTMVPETLRSLFHFRQEHGGPYAICGRISCEDLALSIAFYRETQSAESREYDRPEDGGLGATPGGWTEDMGDARIVSAEEDADERVLTADEIIDQAARKARP